MLRVLTRLQAPKLMKGVRYKSELAGTVDYYNQHIFVPVAASAATWPSHLEKSNDIKYNLFSTLTNTAKEHEIANPNAPKLRITAFEASEKDTDVLLFPEAVNIKIEPSFAEDVIHNQKLLQSTTLPKSTYIFICAHAARDNRCAACGDPIYALITNEIERVGLKDAQVFKCSHVGGHKWAGNVIIFDKLGGNWYGHVKSSTEVASLVSDHLIEGKIRWELWRGQMGLQKEEMELLHAQNTPS